MYKDIKNTGINEGSKTAEKCGDIVSALVVEPKATPTTTERINLNQLYLIKEENHETCKKSFIDYYFGLCAF